MRNVYCHWSVGGYVVAVPAAIGSKWDLFDSLRNDLDRVRLVCQIPGSFIVSRPKR